MTEIASQQLTHERRTEGDQVIDEYRDPNGVISKRVTRRFEDGVFKIGTISEYRVLTTGIGDDGAHVSSQAEFGADGHMTHSRVMSKIGGFAEYDSTGARTHVVGGGFTLPETMIPLTIDTTL